MNEYNRVPATNRASRAWLKHARLLLVKVGTEVITDKEGQISMGRIGNIVEQISRMKLMGQDFILVTSGAVGIGKVQLRKQHMLCGSLQEHMSKRSKTQADWDLRACAAAGQSGMQRFYETLFQQYDVACAQILVTDADFRVRESRENLRRTLTQLLDLHIVPILNENDVISTRMTPLVDSQGCVLWDNDTLAALVACEMNVDAIITLTDTDGFLALSPDGKEVRAERTWEPDSKLVVNHNSRVGREGQYDKLHAIIRAINSGAVKAAVVVNANESYGTLDKVLAGEEVGTFFSSEPGSKLTMSVAPTSNANTLPPSQKLKSSI